MLSLSAAPICMRWSFPTGLEAIARAGAGVNNIPLEKCTEKGIVVFNTPGANANGVKELVLAGMLMAARDIHGGIEWCKGKQGRCEHQQGHGEEQEEFCRP